MNTWTPPPWMWSGYPPQPSAPTLTDVMQGISWFEELKKTLEKEEKEKKEKDKRKKPEAPKFTFTELWGFVMLFSIPVTIGQMAALQYVQSWLNSIAPLH